MTLWFAIGRALIQSVGRKRFDDGEPQHEWSLMTLEKSPNTGLASEAFCKCLKKVLYSKKKRQLKFVQVTFSEVLEPNQKIKVVINAMNVLLALPKNRHMKSIIQRVTPSNKIVSSIIFTNKRVNCHHPQIG